MFEPLRSLKREKLIGLLFVLMLHGVAIYTLWSYRILPTPDEAIILMVNFINPPPALPEPPKPEPPKPVKPPPQVPPLQAPPPQEPPPADLAAKAPVVLPNEPMVYVPPPPPPPFVQAPPLPPQPVVLSGELSVVCPERSPPEYPSLSMRMNEQGKVVLRVELGEDGKVANSEVKTSSGIKRLDDAALNAVKNWHCKPAILNGKAVRAYALQPFNFTLEGR
jgi:protein TonB